MPGPRRNINRRVKPSIVQQTQDVPSLLQSAQEFIDKMDYTSAIVFLKNALIKEPENITVVDMTAATLMEMGNDDEAFPLLVKSAQVDPEHNFEKWMYLGQLQNGNDAVTCYRKGIQLLENDLSQMPDGDDKQLLLHRLCGAYCSVGELYMTDLCEEDGAEQNCEGCILHGLSICSDSVEGLVSLASCRMSQCRFDEAEEILMKVNEIIAGIDTTHDLLPAYEVRMFAGKMLLELDNDDSCKDRCEAAINLFDQLLLENDENNELLFLTATAHYNLQAWSLSLDFATELEKRLNRLLKQNPNIPELQAQMNEVQILLNDIRQGMAEHPEVEQPTPENPEENQDGGMQIE